MSACSWRGVHVFQMDEFLDWQGRLIAVSHPLGFERAMRRFFASIDPVLGIPDAQYHAPHPFRIDEIGEARWHRGIPTLWSTPKRPTAQPVELGLR